MRFLQVPNGKRPIKNGSERKINLKSILHIFYDIRAKMCLQKTAGKT